MKNQDNKTKEQLSKEINQLKTKVSELEKFELKSRIWLENSPVCTKIVDLDFNLQYMSSSGVRELKIDDITEFYGKPYPLHFYPDSFKIPMRNNLKKVKETGEIITQEAPIVDVNGNELWYHSTLVPVYKEEGLLDYIMVVSLETTARVQTEKALQNSNSQLTSILESPDNVIMFALDTDYNYLSFNQAHAREMKYIYNVDIEIGKQIIDYIPNEEDRAKVLINYKRVLKGERFIEIQEYGDADNRYWYELIFNPIFDSSENVDNAKGFTVFVTNITERKKAEEKLKESEILYRLISEKVNLISWVFDIVENRWTYVSPQVEQILGYTPKEFTDLQFWIDNIHLEDREWAAEYCEECTIKGKAHEFEYRFLKKDGSPIWLHDIVNVEMRDNQPVILRGAMIDISERKQAEEELTKHRENLEEMVLERTKELETKNKELDIAMKVFVGREQKIRDLEKRLGAFEGK
jgi:PAS domain S-box-containing protein